MSKLLLVEGNDDKHVVKALLTKFEIPNTFEIEDRKGIDGLLESLPVRLKVAEIEKIAIIVDADQNLSRRWMDLRKVLEELVISFPDLPDSDGTLLRTHKNQEIMIWVMPNNQINGMLEDFISFLIPENDLLSPIVENTLNEIEENNMHKYNLIHRSKAYIHTWLAWQEDPGTPLGWSITKRYLTTDEKTCIRFVDWLKKI